MKLPVSQLHCPGCQVHNTDYHQWCADANRLCTLVECFHTHMERLDDAEKRVKLIDEQVRTYLPLRCIDMWERTLKCARTLSHWLQVSPEELGEALLFAADAEGLYDKHPLPVFVVNEVINHVLEDACQNARSLVIFASLWASDEHDQRLDWCLRDCTCPRPVPLWKTIVEDCRSYVSELPVEVQPQP